MNLGLSVHLIGRDGPQRGRPQRQLLGGYILCIWHTECFQGHLHCSAYFFPNISAHNAVYVRAGARARRVRRE